MKLKGWLSENKKYFFERDLRFLVKNFTGNHYNYNFDLSTEKLASLNSIRDDYLKGVPLAYLLQKEEFFGVSLFVNNRVLIPRPETEIIVEQGLSIIKEFQLYSILDLCCGSLAVAIALAKNLNEGHNIVASDIDRHALSVARINNYFHQTNINIVASDLLSAFAGNSFDMIIANPPYVESGKIVGSLKQEPSIALDGGVDGLTLIKKVLQTAPHFLREKGWLLVEFGYNQREMISDIVGKLNIYQVKQWIVDYNNQWRGVILRRI
jgi:release factor glutamine methyltransferase